MKIALLTDRYPPHPGGLAISAGRLAGLLTSAGHTVHVFVPSAELAPGVAVRSERAGITIHQVGRSRRAEDSLADWFDYLVARQAEERFSLLHAYFVVPAGFLAVYAGRTLGLPTVVSARGNDLERAAFDGSKTAQVLYTLQNADALTANARLLARKAESLAPGRTVTVVPNGVDAECFRPDSPDLALKHSLGLQGLPVIGFAGEARAKKGLGVLLMAFRECARRQPAALLLAGGVRAGDDSDLLQVFRAQNPGLTMAVLPYMPQESLPAYYNLMDVMVMPSLRDGLPNALLEAMACSRPVVGTRAGGIPDALTDGENGILISPGDVAACTSAMSTLLRDPEQRRTLGSRARETVLQNFTPAQELAGNLAVYRRLIGEP